jgi:poly(A) polymerase Pap1
LDLLVSTFDCYFDRRSFFIAFEKLLQASAHVREVVLVMAVNVPVVKFKIGNISVDLTFVDFKKPNVEGPLPNDYFTTVMNISHQEPKSVECMHGYLMMTELQQIITRIDSKRQEHCLQLFQRVTQVIKTFCQNKGIYSYKMGYLNGISIMIMVVYVIIKAYQTLKPNESLQT